MYPLKRNRRLRSKKSLRNLVRETTIHPHDFIVPLFLVEGKNIKDEIPSGPKPSINFPSKNFQKNKPSFFEGFIKMTSYNSSKYHLLTRNLYNGLFILAISFGNFLFLTNK